MYERFTDRSRKVMQFANQEAQRLNHEYIGTEHILLALVKEGNGVAGNVLKNLGIDLKKIRDEVGKLVTPGPEMVTLGKLPQTPRAKKAIEHSMEEARNLFHNHIGTEHLLLGLLREEEGIASNVLTGLGLTADQVRANVLEILGQAEHSVQVQSQSQAVQLPFREITITHPSTHRIISILEEIGDDGKTLTTIKIKEL